MIIRQSSKMNVTAYTPTAQVSGIMKREGWKLPGFII